MSQGATTSEGNATLKGMLVGKSMTHIFLDTPAASSIHPVDILNEIAACSQVNLEAASEMHQNFLRAARSGDYEAVTSALADAMQSSASAQKLEQMLRKEDIDCWILAMPPRLTMSSVEGYVLMMALNQHQLLLETFFKDSGSYTANFNKLPNAEQLPCKCHPRRKPGAAMQPEGKNSETAD
jgi:hypothetical protein